MPFGGTVTPHGVSVRPPGRLRRRARFVHTWALTLCATAGACLLAGCEDRQTPDPRFEAPLVSGVLPLPTSSRQRFDELLTADDTLTALANSDPQLRVDAAMAGVFVAHVPKQGFEPTILGDGISALEAIRDQGRRLVVGSGYVKVYRPTEALGLLLLDGRVNSELSPHGYTRILGTSFGALGVVGIPRPARRDSTASSEYHPDLFESAMQVGPGIVQSGKLDIRPRERETRKAFVRAFVGVCADRWLAGVAVQPIHLYDLGSGLLAYLAAEGIVCDEVVNLSGDREALLAIGGSDQRSIAYFGNPTLKKAAIVTFEPTR